MVVRERRRKKCKTKRRTRYNNTRRRVERQTRRVKKRHSKRVKKRRRKTNMSNKMNRKKYNRTIRRQRLIQEGGMDPQKLAENARVRRQKNMPTDNGKGSGCLGCACGGRQTKYQVAPIQQAWAEESSASQPEHVESSHSQPEPEPEPAPEPAPEPVLNTENYTVLIPEMAASFKNSKRPPEDFKGLLDKIEEDLGTTYPFYERGEKDLELAKYSDLFLEYKRIRLKILALELLQSELSQSKEMSKIIETRLNKLKINRGQLHVEAAAGDSDVVYGTEAQQQKTNAVITRLGRKRIDNSRDERWIKFAKNSDGKWITAHEWAALVKSNLQPGTIF